MLSLLYSENAVVGKIGERTLYHLSLDRAFEHIRSDIKSTEQFLEVLSSPLLDKESIIYRQEIILDFLQNPELLPGLSKLLERLSDIKKDHENARKDIRRNSVSPEIGDNIALERLQLTINALTLKKILILIKTISDFLSGFVISSKGIIKLKETTESICKPKEYSELLSLCTYFENISSRDSVDLNIALGKDGQMCLCDLIPHEFIRITESDLKRKKHWFGKFEDDTAYPCVQLNYHVNTVYSKIRSEPFKALVGLLGNLSEQIFGLYHGRLKECRFYSVTVDYCSALKKKCCPLCFPNVSENGGENIKGLRDLFLLMQYPDAKSVIPNDFGMSEKQSGTVVFGKNGGGKTVFLRSVGTAQIIAQAGLPIPAEAAEICCYDTVFSQFSEAEKNFNEGNDAGRFEQEVSEISEMLDEISENTLILLNETFQSTAYDEGAEGLSEILKYFSSVNSKWLLVSHIHQIKKHLPNTTVFHEVGDNYFIE